MRLKTAGCVFVTAVINRQMSSQNQNIIGAGRNGTGTRDTQHGHADEDQ
jgi:hypothetical protein